jgi:hypothetical protein
MVKLDQAGHHLCVVHAAALDVGLPHSERVIRVHPCLKYGTVCNKPGNLYLCSSMLAFDYDDSEAPKAVVVQQQLQGSAAAAGATGGSSSSQFFSPAAAGDTGSSQASMFGLHSSNSNSGSSAFAASELLLSVGSRVLVRYADIQKLKQEKGAWGDKHWLVVVYAGGLKGEPCTLELGGGGQQQVSDMLADLYRVMAAASHE